jgi:hypothetical protein
MSGPGANVSVTTTDASGNVTGYTIIVKEDGTYVKVDQNWNVIETGTVQEGEDLPRTEEDPDGDGNPGGEPPETAAAEDTEEETENNDAGGGDQGGEGAEPRYSDRGGAPWTPLNGTVDRRVTPFDKTSQPPPTDVQGTVMVSGGKSGPTLGPEAVTNTGGGDFIAGEGRGGGGSMIDPCATVRGGCGGDPDSGGIGPAGPATSN